MREDHLAEAKQVLLKALEMVRDAPARGATYLWLIETALRTGDYHEARHWCQQAFQLISHAGTHFNSARALLLAAIEVLAGLGKYEQACELMSWYKTHWGEPYFAALARGQTTTCIRKLESQLGTTGYLAAVTRGQDIDPDEVIPSLNHELSKLEQLAEADAISIDSAGYCDPLTERELGIIHLLAAGKSNQEIADKLVLTVGTVKWYLHQIYGKLHVTNRTQAVSRARELKILS